MSATNAPRLPREQTVGYWVRDLREVVAKHGPVIPIQACSCGGYAFTNEDGDLACLMCGKVKVCR